MERSVVLFLFMVLGILSGAHPKSCIINNGRRPEKVSSVEMNASPAFFRPARQARPFSLNPSLLEQGTVQPGDTILLDLFEGKNYQATVERFATDINGTVTVTSRLAGFRNACCIITICDDNFLVNIDIPELREKYAIRKNPVTRASFLFLLDESKLGILPGGPSLIPPVTDGVNRRNLRNSVPYKKGTVNPGITPSLAEKPNDLIQNLNAGINDPAQIDVLVVYTNAAKLWAASNEGNINNTIAGALAYCNLASTNSDLGISYVLVRSEEIVYTETGNTSTDLTNLQTKGDGFMDNVHTLRDQYVADLVVLLTVTEDVGGLGYLLSQAEGNESHAFSVSRVQQASGTTTTIHEIGHNMGASHHKLQASQPGPGLFSYSAGWRWKEGSTYYCDLMTYTASTEFPDGNPSTDIPNFSNPDVSHSGYPTGNAADGNNARTLKEVKHYVAQYRDANTLLYCLAAGDGSSEYISNVSAGAINQNSGYSPYSDFSFQYTDVTEGVNVSMSVAIGNPYYLDELIVWVDWNDDKDFTDTGEQVYKSGAVGEDGYNVSFIPPAGITAGKKRMRIRLHGTDEGPNTTPCGNSTWGEVEDYSLNVVPVTWTGTSGGNWATPANWSNSAVPAANTHVVIPNVANDPVISVTTGANVKNMNIASGATLTIQSDGTNSGSLIIYGTISGTGASEKFLKYNRYMRADGYQYFSSPVSGQNLSGWTSGATVYDWSEPIGNWIITSDVSFTSGKGYSWTHPSAAGTVAFTGNYVNSATVVTTSPFIVGPAAGDDLADYNALALVSGRSRTNATWGAGGWNLLGNPFTSAMVPSVFISTNAANFDPNYQAVYVYAGNEGAGGVYYYYGVDGDDGATVGWSESPLGNVLQVGQGFFVLAKNNSTSFSFAPAMQTHSTGTALKTAQTPSSPGFRLKARFGTGESSTLVIFNDQMTAGLDPGYDIGFLSAGQDVEIFTALVKDNGFDFTRQLLPFTGNEKNSIPVGISSEKGGVVTFSAIMVPVGNGTFYLEDKVTGTITDLSKDTYTVNLPEKTAGTGRFFIHTTMATGINNPPLGGGQGGVLRIWTANHRVNIEGAVSAKATGAIYDLLGRQLLQTRLEDTQFNTISVPESLRGVYLVKVTDGARISTEKVVF